jgi:hypothetical protein
MCPFTNPFKRKEQESIGKQQNGEQKDGVSQPSRVSATTGESLKNFHIVEEFDPQLERKLKLNFDANESWGFNGEIAANAKVDEQLKEPKGTLDVLNEFRTYISHSEICIVPSKGHHLLVCNTKPKPICFISNLDSKGIDEILALFARRGNSVTLYKGKIWSPMIWFITL